MGIGNPPLLTLKYALSILEIMGAFIISCIKRRNMMRKLENMSYKDALYRKPLCNECMCR